jgi:plasmid stabilization system protein ParE
MKPRLIVTTPEADDDASQIDGWWVEHRSSSQNLFLEELAHALALLEVEPGVGVRVARRGIPGLRRYLLRATRYHLYFVYDDDVVVIVGVWGATRGTAPRLAGRAASVQHARSILERSTSPGYVNRNHQVVIRRTERPGNDHLQRVYELCCQRCDHRYGANGSDIFQRRCPSCQDGAPGLPLE